MSDKKNPLFKGVNSAEVARLLRQFSYNADSDIRFQPKALAELITAASPVPELREWDVVIPNGEGATETIGSLTITKQQRSVKPNGNNLVVSGNNRRVASRGIESEGMDKELVRKITAEAKEKGKNPSQAGKSIACSVLFPAY